MKSGIESKLNPDVCRLRRDDRNAIGFQSVYTPCLPFVPDIGKPLQIRDGEWGGNGA